MLSNFLKLLINSLNFYSQKNIIWKGKKYELNLSMMEIHRNGNKYKVLCKSIFVVTQDINDIWFLLAAAVTKELNFFCNIFKLWREHSIVVSNNLDLQCK